MLHLLHALTPRDAVRLAGSPQGAELRYGAHPTDRRLIAVYSAAVERTSCDVEWQNGAKAMTNGVSVGVNAVDTSV